MALVDNIGTSDQYLGPKKFRKPNILLRIIKNFSLILFFSVIVFFAINLPAYLTIGRYRANPTFFAFSQSVQQELTVVSSAGTYKPTKQYPDNSIFIPKIGVTAPVSYDIGEGEVMEKLKSGVVHLSGSAHLGEGANIFVTGHSSNYWWENGEYNTVFALLPELESDDIIYLTDNGKLKRFKVIDKKEVRKSEVDGNLISEGEQLTLMTCVPIGTNLRRLLIVAIPD